MKIRYTRHAVKRITDAYDYIAVDNQAAANRFVRRIEGLATLVANFPG